MCSLMKRRRGEQARRYQNVKCTSSEGDRSRATKYEVSHDFDRSHGAPLAPSMPPAEVFVSMRLVEDFTTSSVAVRQALHCFCPWRTTRRSTT